MCVLILTKYTWVILLSEFIDSLGMFFDKSIWKLLNWIVILELKFFRLHHSKINDNWTFLFHLIFDPVNLFL